MSEKMDLETTWKNCLAMWKWIAEQIEAGDKRSVTMLKNAWIRKHGFEAIMYDCFFCDYVISKGTSCRDDCPARLIDPDFNCRNPKYDFYDEPLAFNAKLVVLNKERTK